LEGLNNSDRRNILPTHHDILSIQHWSRLHQLDSGQSVWDSPFECRSIREAVRRFSHTLDTERLGTRPWKQKKLPQRNLSFDNFNTWYYYLSSFTSYFIPVHGSCYDTDTRWRLITMCPRPPPQEVLREFPPLFFRSFRLMHAGSWEERYGRDRMDNSEWSGGRGCSHVTEEAIGVRTLKSMFGYVLFSLPPLSSLSQYLTLSNNSRRFARRPRTRVQIALPMFTQRRKGLYDSMP